jgi:hypothetical protein
MSGKMSDRRVIFEFITVGNYVKVSAIDPVSLTEVSIVGNPASSEEVLKNTALRKLRYVMEKNGKK